MTIHKPFIPKASFKHLGNRWKKTRDTLIVSCLLAVFSVSLAGANTIDDKNLSSQIESLKQAMVNLNRDLFILEEDLLFPSSTQVAIYLAMDVGEYFALDAVELKINDQVKTYYLYTDRQVDALYRGGVQRLYVGNINQGEHELTAFFIGIGPENREYKRAVSLTFTKDEDPIAIELNVKETTQKQQPVFTAKTLEGVT